VIRSDVRRLLTLKLRRRDWEREVEDEIRLHLELRAESLAGQGMPADRATAEAIRRFGSLTEARARLVDAARHREQRMQRVEFWSTARQDLAFAVRTLGRNKTWTAVAVLTLGLGIGATTSVFSATSSLLLHPLPYPDADRVVIVQQQPSKGNNTGVNVSISPNRQVVSAWMSAAHSFQDLEPYDEKDGLMRTHGDPSPVHVAAILPSFLRFAGVRPVIGRVFSASEVAAHAPVLLLGEDAWRTRFGSDPAVLGRAITIDDTAYAIVGVVPQVLRVPSVAAKPAFAWTPLNMADAGRSADVVGRLARGASVGTATRELESIQARVLTRGDGPGVSFTTILLDPSRLLSFRQSLVILTWAVALVLLVACTNVAHLVLARTASRGRELAIRTAIGASSGRVFRQLLTESAALAFAGGILGVVLAWVGVKATVGIRPAGLPELASVRLDGTTLVLTACIAVFSAVAFGVVGAVRTGRRTHDSLKAGALSTSHSRAQDRVRNGLVVTEMAMSALLLVGASLLVRSVIHLQNADLGFDPHGLYAIETGIAEPAQDSANTAALAQDRRNVALELRERLQHAPHVKGLTFSGLRPSTMSFMIGALEAEGGPVPDRNTMAFIGNNSVTPDYFAVMKTRLVNGGTFTDTSDTSPQVIVNEGFAREQWSGASPIGRRVRLDFHGHPGPWWTVVGVAQNVASAGPTEEGSAPLLYFPERYAGRAPALLVRTDGSKDAIAGVQAIVRSIDPARMHPKVFGVEAMLDRSLAQPRFVTMLLLAFTALATVLAAIGMYGVMAYGVAQRTREIGIRIALGAPAARIGRAVVLRGAGLAVAGAVVGLAVAGVAGRVLQSQLYGVSAHDPVSFAAGFALLFIIAVLACVAPTRRAVRIDPLTAIRTE